MEKSELFPTVVADGALPRKTFSMGRGGRQALLHRGAQNKVIFGRLQYEKRIYPYVFETSSPESVGIDPASIRDFNERLRAEGILCHGYMLYRHGKLAASSVAPAVPHERQAARLLGQQELHVRPRRHGR